VLRLKDVKAFKAHVASHPHQAGRLTHCLMLNDELAEIEMYRAIVVRSALKDIHQEATEWLRARRSPNTKAQKWGSRRQKAFSKGKKILRRDHGAVTSIRPLAVLIVRSF
jgi:hypothetical protein